MKRLFFKLLLVVPVFALAGCVETLEDNPVPSSRKVTFQTASYPTTRTTGQPHKGTEFTYDHFMTFAWSDAVVADDKVFMNHQRVEKSGNGEGATWEPTSVYYWPTYTPVDFISYFPEKTNYNLTVERETLTYTGYEVYGTTADITTETNDLMYADKAVGYGANVDEVNDDLGGANDHGYTGVPTLFNHALAQLEIRVLVQQPEGETTFHWEAVIDQAELKGLYTKGDLTLTLENPSETHGVVKWVTKGEGDAKTAGWVNDGNVKEQAIVGGTADKKNFTVISTEDYGVKNGEEAVVGCKSMYKAFVLPQVLEETHLLDLKLTVNKYTTDGNVLQTSEKDKEVRHLQLKTGDITVWGMNQRVVYTIVINPAKNGKILFDPAIKEWKDVTQEKDADDVMKYYIEIPGEEQWAVSNVWHAYDKDGLQVAEMSKELIRDPNRAYYQAVIVNPVVNGKTDLKNGFIAQVLKSSKGAADNLAGGSVSYLSGVDINYTNKGGLRSNTKLGSEANYTYCMVEDGKIVGIRETKGLAKYTTRAYTVTDNNIDNNVYPVVRTGAFYWLRENLRTTHYTDGTPIADAATTEVKDSNPAEEAKRGIRIFHDKAAYMAPANRTQDDIKKYGLLYNFHAVSGADDNGDYWCQEPLNIGWGTVSALAQKGTPYVKDEESNPTICPDGWYIPHTFAQWWSLHLPCDIDYLDSYLTSFTWQYLMSEEQPLLKKYPVTNNFSGFSLNLCPGYNQVEGTFGLANDFFYPAMKSSYSIPFWTANLVMNNNLLYPAPGFLQADATDIWYQATTDNCNYVDFLEMIGKGYYPVRCVRIEQ